MLDWFNREWMELKVHELSTLGIICLVCTSHPMIQHFVAAAFNVVAERATLLCNKLRSKVAQQKCGVSSALVSNVVSSGYYWVHCLVVDRTLYVTQRYTQGGGSAGEDVKHLRDQLMQAEKQVWLSITSNNHALIILTSVECSIVKLFLLLLTVELFFSGSVVTVVSVTPGDLVVIWQLLCLIWLCGLGFIKKYSILFLKETKTFE